MKAITMHETVLRYKAIDGTIFSSEEECRKYENTCKCILNAKYKDYIIVSDIEYNIFNIGSEVCILDIVKVPNQQAVDNILQMAILINTTKEAEFFDKLRERIVKCMNNNDYLIIAKGENNTCFWVENHSFKEYINHLNNLINSFETP